jgi:hypothetical protein
MIQDFIAQVELGKRLQLGISAERQAGGTDLL